MIHIQLAAILFLIAIFFQLKIYRTQIEFLKKDITNKGMEKDYLQVNILNLTAALSTVFEELDIVKEKKDRATKLIRELNLKIETLNKSSSCDVYLTKSFCMKCAFPDNRYTPEQAVGFCKRHKDEWLKTLKAAFSDTKQSVSAKFKSNQGED